MAEILGWVALGLIPAFLLLDFFVKARRFDTPRFWRLYSFIVTAAIVVLTYQVGVWFGEYWPGMTLFDLSGWGMLGGAAVGVFVYEFGHYWFHRASHTWRPLWRFSHQMHHSAESLDAFGAYYISPIDATVFTLLATLVGYPLLGLSPEAGGLMAVALTFFAMFQHANIRTPRWLGYIIQRPESHAVHHGRRVHRYNYADLPLWDMVFGTFRNPAAYQGEVGFYKGGSARIGAMLIGKDIERDGPARPARRPAKAGLELETTLSRADFGR